ncbi:calcium-binding and coiled-coil domain-containing protein 1-A [Xenopus laevis]|uniref:calcium-binding and coiled-coil domain-containing protein 1-A n=1 Tax=Xenopus laevis TaxID=8355 RepID=UPI00000FCC7E|nr:calcium-binding and coiled-coil domain-containing protein 1-A [Xenopus laevis]AAG33628.1 nuclear domain-10 protein NDP52 [Xenopus laevis]
MELILYVCKKVNIMENISQPQLPMGVSFLNVAHTYVPNTKVECHYTIPFGMKSSTRDWIGIFKVNTSSIRDYETFVWAVPPENAGERSISHCSVQFQAYYLPHPGEQQYHFHYVDQCGSVRGCSESFVFGEPQPMEEMVTLEDEDSCLDMLLIVPKATFLQNQLEMAQKERNDLMRARLALEEEVISKEKRICYLEAALDISEKTCFSLKEQCEDLVTREQIAKGERNLLNCQEAELRERILQLESEIQSMNKKMQENDRVLEGTVAIKFSLETEKGELKQRLGETTVEIERYQLQVDSLREKLRSSQDMLSSSQQKALLMGEELASMSSIRDCTISDLHKSRLETADLAIKVSDLSVKFKEGMGQWWQEKTALNHSMEAKRDQIVNLKAEKLSLDNSLQEERSQRQALQCKLNQETDARQVQLSENRRELSELKSALKVAQMEKEQLIEERQEIHQYVRRLEERLDKLADEKWKEDKMLMEDKTDSSPPTLSVDLSDSDDESPGDEGVSQQLGPCSLDEQDLSLNLPVFPCEPQKVVINQPAPIACQLQPLPEDNPDSW